MLDGPGMETRVQRSGQEAPDAYKGPNWENKSPGPWGKLSSPRISLVMWFRPLPKLGSPLQGHPSHLTLAHTTPHMDSLHTGGCVLPTPTRVGTPTLLSLA